MLGNAFSGWHLLIILAVILLLFGAAKLPALAKSMGQSARLFRSEIKEMKKDDTTPEGAPEARDVPPTSPDAPRGTADPRP